MDWKVADISLGHPGNDTPVCQEVMRWHCSSNLKGNRGVELASSLGKVHNMAGVPATRQTSFTGVLKMLLMSRS